MSRTFAAGPHPRRGHRPAGRRIALRPLPRTSCVVARRHLRPVGKDCLVAFAGNLCSVPARKVPSRRLVEVRAAKSQVVLHAGHRRR
ncbi:Mu transposase domain-containing protein [Streptomyces galbus]|uniref:Mu transposase domain-containing protein n=1 Tax=Streptomyces galbus TaxID=33898 RepID=UPI0035710A40